MLAQVSGPAVRPKKAAKPMPPATKDKIAAANRARFAGAKAAKAAPAVVAPVKPGPKATASKVAAPKPAQAEEAAKS
jgi:hypothetical protein